MGRHVIVSLLLSMYLIQLPAPTQAQPAAKHSPHPPAQTPSGSFPRPRLVVGIVVDQMRWDYLYRYFDRYDANGGFKRFINQGFSCENTFIPYVPTITACGHSSIFSGSVPAISGISGNTWWDRDEKRTVY